MTPKFFFSYFLLPFWGLRGLVGKSSHFNAEGAGSIPGWGAKIPAALLPNKPKHKTEAILLK